MANITERTTESKNILIQIGQTLDMIDEYVNFRKIKSGGEYAAGSTDEGIRGLRRVYSKERARLKELGSWNKEVDQIYVLAIRGEYDPSKLNDLIRIQ